MILSKVLRFGAALSLLLGVAPGVNAGSAYVQTNATSTYAIVQVSFDACSYIAIEIRDANGYLVNAVDASSSNNSTYAGTTLECLGWSSSSYIYWQPLLPDTGTYDVTVSSSSGTVYSLQVDYY